MSSTVNFYLYPGYTQGQSVRSITVENNTGATVTDIHFANFNGTKGTFVDGSKEYAPYGVVDSEYGSNFLTDCFFDSTGGGSVSWVPWAEDEGYTSLAAGQSRTYYLALEVGGLGQWLTLAKGTNLSDRVDLVCSAGTTTLTLNTRVYEPAGVTAQIGTKTDALSQDIMPVSSVKLASMTAGVNGSTVTLLGLKNTSSTTDSLTGRKPSIVLRSVGIEGDSSNIFGVVIYSGSSGSYGGTSANMNMTISPDASSTFGVTADARYVPAGTYTATLCLYVSPSNISFNYGVQVGSPSAEGYTPVRIPVSVTVTGDNSNLRPVPGNLKATASNGAVELSWSAVAASEEGFGGYLVWREDWEPGQCVSIGQEQTFYVDKDVVNGTQYTYYVSCKNGGTEQQDRLSSTAGPVSATPSISLPVRLDAPDIDVNLDGLNGAVRALWYLQDWDDNGSGTVDHFNVYLDKKKVAEVKQSAAKNDSRHGPDVYYWTCDAPVSTAWEQCYVNVAAVSTTGVEGFWSEWGSRRYLDVSLLEG